MSYFRIDYNGSSGERGRFGSNMPLLKNLLQIVYLNAMTPDKRDSLLYMDPGIGKLLVSINLIFFDTYC